MEISSTIADDNDDVILDADVDVTRIAQDKDVSVTNYSKAHRTS